MTGNPWYRLNTFRVALRLASILPRDMVQEMAGELGLFGYRFAQKGREAARANLARISGLQDTMLDELCRQNFAQFLRMMADYFYCSVAPADDIRALVDTWKGFEHITAAREKGKGGILVTAHVGNWELGGIILALAGVPLTVVTLQEPTGELTEWREACRKRLGIKTIAIGSDPFSFVGIVSALRRNEFVAMLVDRPYGDSAVPVRFFGAEAQFSSAASLLHGHTGAAVIPAFVLQKPDGRYVSVLEPPVPMSIESAESNVQRIATVFEAVVRRSPDQWFNYVPIWK